MTTKELSTRVDIVKRSKGQSAVDKAAYISRTTIKSDYDGVTYYPKYSEDLVHSEIMLPENAPEEYADRSTLWNAVEQAEKSKNAQLARMYKVSLPNDWSYEFAIEVMRDYINRNFVSQGMCADFAIHDSENDKHQRNLHCHIMLTMRGIDKNGKWLPKKRKITLTDENGERIPIIDKKTGKQKVDKQNRKQWKTETVSTNDWDSRDNAKYIAKIGHRNELQNPDNVKRIAEAKKWETFEQVKDDYARDGTDFDEKEVDINKQFLRLQHLNKLMQAYKDFKPIMEVHSEYDKLKGIAKIKYKKEHSYELEQYPELREKYEELVGENKRFRPDEWQSEIEQIEHSIDEYKHHASGRAFILATAEVLFHNRKELERLRENEEREKNRQKERVKNVNRGID